MAGKNVIFGSKKPKSDRLLDASWLASGDEKEEETFLAFVSMISHLADVPFFLDELAGLHVAEWWHLYSGWGAEAVRAEFLGQRADGCLPATLVLHEGVELVGSVSVVFGDCPARPDLDPWLASLYVVPERRGRGHGLELVRVAIDFAASAGERRLHVFTESAEGLFEGCGFEMLERTMQQGVPISVLGRTLP